MTINFSKNFYTLKSIKKAVNAYKPLANFSVSSKKDYFEVGLKNMDKEVEDIISDEFGNYVLHELIVDYKHGKN